MQTITLRSKINAEGFLLLKLPVPNRHSEEVEVTVKVYSLPRPKPFPITRLEDGVGCVGYTGPAKSLEEMEQGMVREARRQWLKENQV